MTVHTRTRGGLAVSSPPFLTAIAVGLILLGVVPSAFATFPGSNDAWPTLASPAFQIHPAPTTQYSSATLAN
jgi:hypothetical protein